MRIMVVGASGFFGEACDEKVDKRRMGCYRDHKTRESYRSDDHDGSRIGVLGS